MGRRRAPRCGHPPSPLLPSSVDVGALDQERDPYVGAPLIEVLAAQSGGDDVDRADVPKRALRLLQRLLCGVIRSLLGASNQLNDLYDGHEPSSERDGFAASVLLHLRPPYKPASRSGRDSPAAAESQSRADALLQGCLLPAAHLSGPRRRGGLPEETLEGGGDRGGLVGLGDSALDLNPGPGGALLSVAGHERSLGAAGLPARLLRDSPRRRSSDEGEGEHGEGTALGSWSDGGDHVACRGGARAGCLWNLGACLGRKRRQRRAGYWLRDLH